MNDTTDREKLRGKLGSHLKNLPPTIGGRVALALAQKLSPQKTRLLEYLINHPDSFTHELAMHCRVGYPPNRLGELNKEILPRLGLQVHCHLPNYDYLNSFGERSHVHQWRLVKSQ